MTVQYKGYIFPRKLGIDTVSLLDIAKRMTRNLPYVYDPPKACTKWSKKDKDFLLHSAQSQLQLGDIAEHLGRTPHAVLCQLDVLTNFNLNEGKNIMNDQQINENVVSLTITMNELTDTAIEGLKFYSVSSELYPNDTENRINNFCVDDNILTEALIFKSLEEYENGDLVLVPILNNFGLGRVIKEIDQPTNYQTVQGYSWIIANVSEDLEKFNKAKEYEKDLVLQIKNVQREKAKSTIFEQLLGKNFKALTFEK